MVSCQKRCIGMACILQLTEAAMHEPVQLRCPCWQLACLDCHDEDTEQHILIQYILKLLVPQQSSDAYWNC